MTFHILALILAGILSFADYVTEHIFSKRLRTNQKLVSFSAGVAISYIVLSLFPEISYTAFTEGRGIFLYALAGFVTLNMVEQYIYKGVGKLKKTSAYHKSIHVTYFFIYNFLIGMVLVLFTARGPTQALIFFIPFFFYIVVEILPQEFAFKNHASKIIYSMAPLFGAVMVINAVPFVSSIFGELVSFITGTMLYIVIRESLPSDEAEKPLYFVIGILFYTLLLYMSWKVI